MIKMYNFQRGFNKCCVMTPESNKIGVEARGPLPDNGNPCGGGSNTTTVALRGVGGEKKESVESEAVKCDR
jgi:hypothetical protein